METNCVQATPDYAEDCTCQPTEAAISGGTATGSPSNMLSGWQAAASYGGSAQTWRLACVEPPGGTRLPCTSPFVVCLGAPSSSAVRLEVSSCSAMTGGKTECTCQSNEVAIAGGANSGAPSFSYHALLAGPAYGVSPQVWRVDCLDSAGVPTGCLQPFAVCLANPYAASARVETSNCVQVGSAGNLATECTCRSNEVAIAGGANAGSASNSLNSTQAGVTYGASAQTWRVACVDSTGANVACTQSFAVCASSGI